MRAAAPAPVLFIHTGQNWIRGSEQCLLDLVTHLDRARFAPVVCCDSIMLADAARTLGVPVHLVGGWDFAARHWRPAWHEIATLAGIVRDHRVRLVHLNDTDPIKAILPVARWRRIPMLAHLHIRIDAVERRWSMLHQVAFAVGVSRASLQGLLDDGFPERQTAVIYNGIDPARIERGDARSLRTELRIAASAVVVTALGSLIPRKGVETTLAAFMALSQRRSDVHLLFCGDGPERSALESAVQSRGLGRRVHFLGERRDAGAILRDATDILVSASRDEAFPLTLLEAAHFGLPIVASDIEPHREFLADGGPGVLVPCDDSVALADALERLVTDAPQRRVLGGVGPERIRRSHLISHVVARFDAIYSELLARPAREFGWVAGTRWPADYTDRLAAAVRRRMRRGAAAGMHE